MAWDDDMPAILRGLIQDYDTPPLYTDDRLSTQVLVTIPILLVRVAFPNRYSVDISNGTLSPDPTKATPRDDAFITLACLMAAQNLILAEVRDMTRQGIDIQDGDGSRIKLSRDPKSLELMQRSFSQMFDDALYAYKTGGDSGFGEIIVSPYHYIHGGHGHDLYGGYYGGRTSRGPMGLY